MIIKKLQEELDKNEEYKDLLLERKEIFLLLFSAKEISLY